jgi:glutathionylspermidine synthase
MLLDCFKWDPQVGDVASLAPFPLILPESIVRELGQLAERLAAEVVAAESELSARPDLLKRLGLPKSIRRVLSDYSQPPTPAAARVIRFDFHPTTDGWRISEANSDVPGGYTESAHFSRLMAEHYAGTRPAGDPATALAAAIHANAGGVGMALLLAAPGYMEDQQVIACLADALRRRGWATVLAHPGQVEWRDGFAHLRSATRSSSVDVVVRFFQGEWLTRLPAASGWRRFFRGGRTPVCNPGIALLAESKRFPLIWDELDIAVPTWRVLLPETRDPYSADWRNDTDWLLKAAFANNGDEVADRRLCAPREWWRTAWAARLRPGHWAAQRRFTALAVKTPAGMMYPCLGAYTVDGRAAGIYGRMASRPLIDYAAVDVPVLVRSEVEEKNGDGTCGVV